MQKVSSFQLKNASAIRIGNLLSIPGSLDAPPKAISSWHWLLECAWYFFVWRKLWRYLGGKNSGTTVNQTNFSYNGSEEKVKMNNMFFFSAWNTCPPPQQRQLSINSCPLKVVPIWLAESSAQCQQASKAVKAQPWGSSLWRRDTHLGSPRILATCFLLVKSFASWEQHRTAWSWVKARAAIFKVYRERLICTPNVWVRTSRNLNQALKTGKLDIWKNMKKL